eukprot:scaffold122211_cov36-Phaeocystis_antarctica.AAC.1
MVRVRFRVRIVVRVRSGVRIRVSGELAAALAARRRHGWGGALARQVPMAARGEGEETPRRHL